LEVVTVFPDVGQAAVIAEESVGELGNRWLHVQAVAARAAEIARAVDADDQKILVAAAWLHDIGYGPDLKVTGFHPLDGARHLVSIGADPRLVALVAHHSGATYEATERGLLNELNHFPRADGPLLDALIYADMTTGPDGRRLEFEDRIDEILVRYQPGDPVHRAITNARPYLREAIKRTQARLDASR